MLLLGSPDWTKLGRSINVPTSNKLVASTEAASIVRTYLNLPGRQKPAYRAFSEGSKHASPLNIIFARQDSVV